MKKIILMVFVVLLFVSVNAYSICVPTSGKIVYNNSADAPAQINYQTGVGYCTASTNPGGVVLDLSKCDNVSKLDPTKDYIMKLNVDTNGFNFITPIVDATNISFSVTAFPSMDNLCNSINGTEVTMEGFLYNDNLTILTKPSDDFILVARPFLLVYIPEFTYDKTKVNGSSLKVSVGIYDASVVCLTCGDAICEDSFNIGDMSCTDLYTMLFPYCVINSNEWWTGIAIANLSTYDGVISINVYAPSDIFTFTKIVKGNSVYAFSVDDLLSKSDVDSDTCYVIIKSNSEIDGICIYGNPDGHSAYMGRKQ